MDGRPKPSFSVKERGSNGAFTLFAVFCLKSLVNAPAWCSHGAVRRPRWVKSSPDAPQGRGYSIYEMASGRKKAGLRRPFVVEACGAPYGLFKLKYCAAYDHGRLISTAIVA